MCGVSISRPSRGCPVSPDPWRSGTYGSARKVATIGGRLQRFHCLALLLIAAAAPVHIASAQEQHACDGVMEAAQVHYEDRRFDEVIEVLSRCLTNTRYSNAQGVQMYRLMTLAHIQKNELDEARNVVVKLLGLAYDYEPDPVQDPPLYTALVQAIKQQLRVQLPPPPQPADTAVAAASEPQPVPSAGALAPRSSATVRVGVSSYGGERGYIGGGNLFSELKGNAGPALDLRAEYRIGRGMLVGPFVLFSRNPQVLRQIENTPSVERISRIHSSALMIVTGGTVRGNIPLRAPVAPYIFLGAGASFVRLNDAVRVGLAARTGAGVEVPVSSSLRLVAEFEGVFLVPGDASDLADLSRGFDPFTNFGFGVRHMF